MQCNNTYWKGDDINTVTTKHLNEEKKKKSARLRFWPYWWNYNTIVCYGHSKHQTAFISSCSVTMNDTAHLFLVFSAITDWHKRALLRSLWFMNQVTLNEVWLLSFESHFFHFFFFFGEIPLQAWNVQRCQLVQERFALTQIEQRFQIEFMGEKQAASN